MIEVMKEELVEEAIEVKDVEHVEEVKEEVTAAAKENEPEPVIVNEEVAAVNEEGVQEEIAQEEVAQEEE